MIFEIVLWSAAVFFVLAGLAGLVLPAIPGSPLLFLGLLSAAWAEDFSHVGTVTLVVLGFLAVLAYGADFAAGAFGARRFGASNRSVAGSAIGAVAGLFFGPAGLILGPFVGAVIGELSSSPDVFAAGRAGLGATVGLVLGTAAKISLGLSMLAIYIFVRFVSGA